MPVAADPVAMLSKALDQADAVLTGIHAEQLGQPTPCPDWDVEALVRHVLTGLGNALETARGGSPDWSRAPEPLDEQWLAEFRARSDDLVHAWHQAGPQTGTVELPGLGEVPARFRVDHRTAELAVHAWDLRQATGQRTELDPEVAETALGFMSAALSPAARGEHHGVVAFGSEVPVPADAPAYDRLVAFAGRDPAWSASGQG